MRGARFYRPDVSTRLKKCSEHIGNDCTGCCGPTPCTYCLELEMYGEDILPGTAEASGTHWIGSVGGYDFDAFWERNYETDACEFVVEFGGEEVYRSPCYGDISCRDSSGETSVVIDYEEGTLRWVKHEPLELPHVTGDAGCPTWFCGECECSCDCLCVTITEPDGNVIRGDICNTSYPCDGPVWEGSIGYYDLSLALSRDSYGNCVVVPTVDGYELDSVEVTGCKDMSGSIELYDGTTIAFRCKVCDCPEEVRSLPCCEDIPITAESLNARIGPGLAGFGPEGSFEGCTWEGVLAFVPQMSDQYGKYWAGVLSLTGGGCSGIYFYAVVYCDTTNDHTLCVDFSWRGPGWTLTPLDGECSETGWNTQLQGGCSDSDFGTCAPLGEFSETFDEDLFASCSPLMLYNNHYLAPYLITELALP